MSSTRELAEAVSGIEVDGLGDAEIEAVRRLLLDHLGVAAAGSVRAAGSMPTASRIAPYTNGASRLPERDMSFECPYTLPSGVSRTR